MNCPTSSSLAESKASTRETPKSPRSEGSDFYYRRFLDESPRLFREGTDETETLILSNSHSDVTGIEQSIEKWVQKQGKSQYGLYIHIIRQEYSWGRLLISQASLQSLVSYHDVFSRFYDLINAFGFKTNEDDKVWDGFHSARNTGLSSGDNDVQSERCYSIRYIDKNGRNPDKPWSLRQVGVYQQTRGPEERSVWILVQPPERLYQQLKANIAGSSKHEWNSCDRDMMLHLAVLSVTLSNWDQYIGYLRNELAQLEDKACFSRVGIDKPHDYTVAFGDKQKLQRFREKLLRLESVLNATGAVIKSLKSQFRQFTGFTFTEQHELGVVELDNFIGHCKRHQKSIMTLLQVASGVDELLSKILELRNDRVLLQLNQGMQNSLCMLNQISAQSADVVEQGRLDSKSLRVLTLIATMYLPASLLATLFNSNLIQIVKNEAPAGQAGQTQFKLVSQFWIYALLTVILTAVTLLLAWILPKINKSRSKLIT